METITEEQGVHKQWYKDAKDVKTPEQLKVFVEGLLTRYGHDYGTICHAVAASALAGAYCVNADEKQGGITGFQAGEIMWEFIKGWGVLGKGPMRIMEFEHMLYPQYENQFRTIPKKTWDHLQKKAKENLDKVKDAHKDVKAHWKTVADGKIPFGFTIGEN